MRRGRARLGRLDLYPRPVGTRGVRIVAAPWLFRVPYLRRFDGYAVPRLILLREPIGDAPSPASDDLVCHELCHVWQMQHHPFRLLASVLTMRYELNPFEAEARWAASRTRA